MSNRALQCLIVILILSIVGIAGYKLDNVITDSNKARKTKALLNKNIDHQLGLVVPPTEDAYGTPLRFVEDEVVIIGTSAGRDLEFGTEDDIVVSRKCP